MGNIAVVQDPTSGPEVKWDMSPSTTGNPGVRSGLQLVLITPPVRRYDGVVREVRNLETLTRGWDGHDASPPRAEAIRQALMFLTGLESFYRGMVAPPMVGPLPDGSIAFVWRDEAREVEIIFLSGGEVEYAISDRFGKTPTEVREGVSVDFVLSTVAPQQLIA